MRILSVHLAIVLFLTGCATNAPRNDHSITSFKPALSADKKVLRRGFLGKWLSEQPTKQGGTREALIERFNDNNYLIEFKIYDAAGTLIRTQKEFGVWGVSGGIYFTIFRGWVKGGKFHPSDPSDAYNYDAYKIVEMSEKQLEYLSLSSGNRFTYRRVE